MMSLLSRVLLAVAVLLVVPLPAGAELAAIRPEFQVSTSESYIYYGYIYSQAHNEGRGSVDIDASAGGTFVVAWEDLYEYGPGYYAYSIPGAFVRRVDKFGRAFGPEFRVSALTNYAKGGVAVASDPVGRFMVVWDDYRAEGNYDLGILGRRYDAGGHTPTGPLLINTITTGDQATPKVAADGAGNFMVVWADSDPYGYGYAGYKISGRRFDSAGSAQGDQFQINTSYCDFCAYSGFESFATHDDMDVAGDAGGNFMVVWRGPDGTGSSSSYYADVFGRVFDSTGTPTGPDFLVPTYTTGGQIGPSVVADGAGRFIVAWADGISSYSPHVHARRFDSTGTPLGDEFQVSTQTIYDFTYGPSVAADASGSFVVTWDVQGNGNYYAVYGREFDSTGAPVADQFRIDVADDYDGDGLSRHNVAGSAAGEFVVVWGQPRRDTYYYGVDGRQIGPKPTPCAPAPMMGCKEPIQAKRGRLRFKRSSDPNLNALNWRWAKGQELTAEDLGDPVNTDSYAFCLYDGSANAQPLVDLPVPAGGGCGKIACWREISGGRFDYLDNQRFVGGLELLRVGPKPEGKARAMARARKENLVLPHTPLTPPVTVQVQAANGTCLTAEYGTYIRRNEDDVFVAQPGS